MVSSVDGEGGGVEKMLDLSRKGCALSEVEEFFFKIFLFFSFGFFSISPFNHEAWGSVCSFCVSDEGAPFDVGVSIKNRFTLDTGEEGVGEGNSVGAAAAEPEMAIGIEKSQVSHTVPEFIVMFDFGDMGIDGIQIEF